MSSSPGLEHIASVKVPPLSIAILAVAAALKLSPFGDMADSDWWEYIAFGQRAAYNPFLLHWYPVVLRDRVLVARLTDPTARIWLARNSINLAATMNSDPWMSLSR
jgi:hypothetical protein